MGAISAIILAAGRSRRFGRDKRWEPIDGVPMLLRTALLYKQMVPDTFVVLGPGDIEHERMLNEHGIDSGTCPQASAGMGSSLAYGVAQRPRSLGWLVTPADLPFVQASTIQSILISAGSHALAAPAYQGRRGHPVWFGQCHFEALRALSGPEGAKSILQAAAGKLCVVPVDDPGCVRDIDRPQDLGLS